jgi:hypothetical protein
MEVGVEKRKYLADVGGEDSRREVVGIEFVKPCV